MTDARVTASSADGSIYDLGYRHYEGRRLGRGYAFWSLFVDSFRSDWGLGRPTRAKAAPFIITGLYASGAIFQLAFASVISQAISRGEAPTLLTYDTYFASFDFFLVLFCIAQAPELVCRDQRYSVLPLYYTRALRRFDYPLAKLAALAGALFVALLVPMILLFAGDLLMKTDMLTAFETEWPKALPSIPASAIQALGLAALSLAISAFTPRRAYAAIGLVAYFLLMEGVPTAIYQMGQNADWTWASNLLLVRPLAPLIGASNWLFGLTKGVDFSEAVSNDAYVAAAFVAFVVFGAILLNRFRRITV